MCRKQQLTPGLPRYCADIGEDHGITKRPGPDIYASLVEDNPREGYLLARAFAMLVDSQVNNWKGIAAMTNSLIRGTAGNRKIPICL